MPPDLIQAFAILKEACAAANHRLGKLDDRRFALIQGACQAILAGELAGNFPLAVWQTGSGTQTNMNCNEVIGPVGQPPGGGRTCSTPTHHVNLSQSSNDTFPTALHIAAATALHRRLFPALEEMLVCLQDLENANGGRGENPARTHLQGRGAHHLRPEISGWRSMLEHSRDMVTASLDGLYELALGGTAVGTGSTPLRGLTQPPPRRWPSAPACPSALPPTSSTPSPPRTPWCSPTGP